MKHKTDNCKGTWHFLQGKATSYGGEIKVFYFYCDKCLAIVRGEL